MQLDKKLNIPKREPNKSGYPPETLVFFGKKKVGKPILTLIQYNQTVFNKTENISPEKIADCKPVQDKVTWLNVEGIHDAELIKQIGEQFQLHPLLIEDVLHPNQRPKLEDYDNLIFIVLKMLSSNASDGSMSAEQVAFVVGNDYIITFQEGEAGDVFDTIRERIEQSKGKIRRYGASYLLYELLDAVVDNYFIVIDSLGDRLEDIEEIVLHTPLKSMLADIHILRRELIAVRKIVWPLREVISKLEKGESPIFQEQDIRVYLRDLYDHTLQQVDMIETYRDMLSSLENLYLSSISNRMNEVMKVLTIITTIFIPLGLIAGIYGMNFKSMPELEVPWAYPVVVVSMVLIAVCMLLLFKKKKWF